MDREKLYTLLAREMAGELTEKETVALQQLLQQYPDASYIREVFSQDWKSSGKQYTPLQPQQLLEKHLLRMQELPDHRLTGSPSLRTRSYRTLYIGLAASALILIAAAGFWWSRKPIKKTAIPLAQVVTEKRMRSQVVLPDGSRVWLNAGSKLSYPREFAPRAPRQVSLEGEAFFDVKTDAQRPFQVQTRTFHIRVLGTSFNVRAYPQEDSAVTSLVQGAVEVVLTDAGNQVVALKPNEKLTIPVHSTVATEEKAVASAAPVVIYKSKLAPVRNNIIPETAWVQNKLAFKHLELEKVAIMLEQWYGVEIGFKNNSKKQLYFTGVFETENVEQVLNALETTLSFTWSRDASGKIWIH